MEISPLYNSRVLSEGIVDRQKIDSSIPEDNLPQEEQLNFLAIFTAENGAELKLEFHCSDSAKARDHVDSLIYFFRKDIHFLWISGERWNVEPDALKRVFLKRKIEMVYVEFELEQVNTLFSESLVNEKSAVLV